ncbi:hypothetical protein M3Y97_01083600 [Aphelenchoides bicaudatus]|nr:hypothetical protein M3Y97_01083600 [Aphelenchoides bicaudatus]
MLRLKRKATTNIASPPSKICSKTINGPRLNHNGRLALICFLAHRSHRPTSPDMDDIEMSGNSSSSSSVSVNVGENQPGPVNGDQPELLNVPENEAEEMEMENQSSSSSSESSVSEHQLNLNFLLNEDVRKRRNFTTTSEESLDDEDESTDSESSSDGEHNFLNLLQVLEAAAANDDSEAGSSYLTGQHGRVLMLSSRFLRSFFAGHNVILKVDYDYQNFDLILEWQSVGASMFQLNAKTLSALIGLSELQKIHIVAYAIFEDRPVDIQKGMQSWMQICRALKNSKTLQSISLEIGQTRPSPYRIFFDMIPDKITEIKSKSSIVHGLARRKCLLDGVYLFDCTKKHPDYGQVFRTKTKLLDLTRCSSIMLNDLANVGELSANPYLEFLKIGVLLKDPDSQVGASKKFNENNWTKLEESFMCLKAINEKMELKLITGVFYGDKVKCSRRCPKTTLQQMARSANLKVVDNEAIIDTIVHDGVQINIKLCYGTPQYFTVF